MVSTHHISYRADDRGYFSLIKKDIHKLVINAGYNEKKTGEIDIIVAEITSNLGKHANGGELLVKLGQDAEGEYFEILSLDFGPGMSDVSKVLSDGYSSVNTLGHGLGSIKRLSDTFDIYSLKGWGTILLSRVHKEENNRYKKRLVELTTLNVPKPGEQLSGDGSCLVQSKEGFRVLIADGLGHGAEANHAVKEACEAFKICPEKTATETIRFIHHLTKKTRGLVGIVVMYNTNERKWNLAGVGNIALKWIAGSNVKNYISYNGIIGHNIPGSMNDTEMMRDEFQQFLACSDGIKSRWDLLKFPMILRHDAAICTAAIYREFARRTDDTSVMVCKAL